MFLFLALVVTFLILRAVASAYEAQEKVYLQKALQLADVDNMPGLHFEHYVAKLLTHQGFQTQVTVGSGDLGVDIVASKGSIKYAVQVKRQAKNVSRRAVSDAVAGAHHYKCNASMVITNVFFTTGAQELAKSTGCRLVDRTELTGWIISFQGGSVQFQGLKAKEARETAKNLTAIGCISLAFAFLLLCSWLSGL